VGCAWSLSDVSERFCWLACLRTKMHDATPLVDLIDVMQRAITRCLRYLLWLAASIQFVSTSPSCSLQRLHATRVDITVMRSIIMWLSLALFHRIGFMWFVYFAVSHMHRLCTILLYCLREIYFIALPSCDFVASPSCDFLGCIAFM
jgi:hypothetical protein